MTQEFIEFASEIFPFRNIKDKTLKDIFAEYDFKIVEFSKNETVFNPPNLIDKELNKKSEESIVVNNDSFYKSKKYENDDFSDYFAGVKVAENKNLYETQSQLCGRICLQRKT